MVDEEQGALSATAHWFIIGSLSFVSSGAWLLQRHVLPRHHHLFDVLSGVWHVQELPAVSESGQRSWFWSEHQTRNLPVWLGGRYSSGDT